MKNNKKRKRKEMKRKAEKTTNVVMEKRTCEEGLQCIKSVVKI